MYSVHCIVANFSLILASSSRPFHETSVPALATIALLPLPRCFKSLAKNLLTECKRICVYVSLYVREIVLSFARSRKIADQTFYILQRHNFHHRLHSFR